MKVEQIKNSHTATRAEEACIWGNGGGDREREKGVLPLSVPQ
jgi:hypothetical protein